MCIAYSSHMQVYLLGIMHPPPPDSLGKKSAFVYINAALDF